MKNKENFLKNVLTEGRFPYLHVNSSININKITQDYQITFNDFNDSFLYYKDVRYSLDENAIIEYNIDFFKLPKIKFQINIKELGSMQICSKSKLHEIVRILKYSSIIYHEVKIKDNDYFIIQTESKVNIYFDLETGNLFRIGKLFDSH